MIIKVPLSGRVTDFDPELAKRDNIGILGDDNDPVRVDINLGHVGWTLVSVDLEAKEAEIEVTPLEEVGELKAGGQPDNPRDYIRRPASSSEKEGFLNVAQQRADAAPRGQLQVTSSILSKYKKWRAEKK